MFFANLYGPDTDSALPLLNLLDLLTVKNIYKLNLLNFTHYIYSASIFAMQVKSIHIIRDMLPKAIFYKPRFRTNIGKQTKSPMATEMWQQLPTHVKNFSTHNFPKKLKEYLLAAQLKY